jgi:hypothetical protein
MCPSVRRSDFHAFETLHNVQMDLIERQRLDQRFVCAKSEENAGVNCRPCIDDDAPCRMMSTDGCGSRGSWLDFAPQRSVRLGA